MFNSQGLFFMTRLKLSQQCECWVAIQEERASMLVEDPKDFMSIVLLTPPLL